MSFGKRPEPKPLPPPPDRDPDSAEANRVLARMRRANSFSSTIATSALGVLGPGPLRSSDLLRRRNG